MPKLTDGKCGKTKKWNKVVKIGVWGVKKFSILDRIVREGLMEKVMLDDDLQVLGS